MSFISLVKKYSIKIYICYSSKLIIVYNKNQEVSFMIDIGNSILFFSMLMSGVTGMKADYSKDYITSLDYHSSTSVAALRSTKNYE